MRIERWVGGIDIEEGKADCNDGGEYIAEESMEGKINGVSHKNEKQNAVCSTNDQIEFASKEIACNRFTRQKNKLRR